MILNSFWLLFLTGKEKVNDYTLCILVQFDWQKNFQYEFNLVEFV